jgi:hypothetical protein
MEREEFEMKARELRTGVSIIACILLPLLVFWVPLGPAAAQGLTLGPPHFPPAARPLLDQIPAGGIGHHFQLMDHNPLVAPGGTLPRGGNGNDLAIAGNCLYASSRSNNQGTLIVDISNPKRTMVVGSIPPPGPPPSGRTLSTADISAIESENLLVRQVWNTSPPFDGNKMELYDTTDCFRPRLVSVIDLQNTPHEHFVWQGGSPHRVLLLAGFSSGRVPAPFPPAPRDMDLRVYDITNKAAPVGPVAMWSMQRLGIPTREPLDVLLNAGGQQPNELHAIGISPDKSSPAGFPTQIYVAHRWFGFYIIDSTALATALAGGAPCDPEPNIPGTTDPNPNACLKKLHPDPTVRLDYHPPFNQSHTHSAGKIPGRPYVVLNDEPGPCPWGWVRFVFIDDETEVTSGGVTARMRGDLFPSIFGAFTIPENLVENCGENVAKFPGASFNAHKSLVFRNLMFVSWIAGGVRAIDISNPGTPFEAGFFFNKPVRATADGEVNPELGIRNHPTLKDGLLYFLDGSSGLYVLKYTGPRKEEIPQEGLFTQQQVQVPGRQP